jgi:ADP-glucose pyrophosphorylase
VNSRTLSLKRLAGSRACEEINCVAVTGDTACHLVVRCGYGQVIHESIREGADMTVVNRKGRKKRAKRNHLLKQMSR